MGLFIGLKGVKGGELEGPLVGMTINRFKVALRESRVCSTASDNGAVTVWRDDEGRWRAEYTRFCATVNEAVFETKSQIWVWLKEWMPKCE